MADNLWSYTLRSFLHFPITFNHKSLQTDQHCSQNPVHSLSSVPQTKCQHTAIKIVPKHTHIYTAIASFLKGGRTAKHYEAAVCISTNLFPLNFFILLSLLLNAVLKYVTFRTHPKFQTMYWLDHVFMMRYPNCAWRIHNKSRNVASQCATSL